MLMVPSTHIARRSRKTQRKDRKFSLELIIVPAFAVDEHGFRLGRGGGWYDRALEHRSSTARVVAVCWPWEPTDETVPHEPHDIPVDGVLTPDGYADVRG